MVIWSPVPHCTAPILVVSCYGCRGASLDCTAPDPGGRCSKVYENKGDISIIVTAAGEMEKISENGEGGKKRRRANIYEPLQREVECDARLRCCHLPIVLLPA